ncbi:MAG: hypothetical protein LIO96_01310 [Lachnospiraceae bacterium]|nr:hypothetical protein [Lachnospiraceae bacterium]
MKKWFLAVAACLTLLLSGCDKNEPENDAFPLALGIEAEDNGAFHMYMAYPDLGDADASENALAKDAFWDGTMENLTEGTDQMSRSSNRNVDMNHLKVLILDAEMLDGGQNAEELITFFREKRDASWNAYVFLTERDAGSFFGENSDRYLYRTLPGRYCGRMGQDKIRFPGYCGRSGQSVLQCDRTAVDSGGYG